MNVANGGMDGGGHRPVLTPTVRPPVPFALRHWPVFIAIAVAAVLMFWDLGLHGFWTDEAITALYARSLQHHALPYAWDGRNLFCFGYSGTLTADMYATTYPLLQFYVVLPFFDIFGANAAAGRLPFVLLGLGTIALTYLLALRMFQSRTVAGFSVCLLATSIEFLLFSRQCRYYGLVMFFTVLVLLAYERVKLDRKWSLVAFVAAGLLLFHSQFLIFYALMGGVALAFLLSREKGRRFWAILICGAAMLALTVPWMLIFTKPYGVQQAPLSSAGRVRDAALLLVWFLRDTNRAGFFPVLAFPLLAIFWYRRGLSKPAPFLAIICLVQIVLVSAAGVQSTERSRDADIRYLVNLLPLMSILLGFVCAELWRIGGAFAGRASLVRFAGPAAFVLLAGTNVMTLQPFRCYLADYVYELTHPYKTCTELAIEQLDQLAATDDIVLTTPDYQRAPLVFYLGHKLKFCRALPANENRIVPRNREILPAYIYSPQVFPDWIVMFRRRDLGPDISGAMAAQNVEYYDPLVLPTYWQDQSRPELFWHRFEPWPDTFPPNEHVFIFKKRPTASAEK